MKASKHAVIVRIACLAMIFCLGLGACRAEDGTEKSGGGLDAFFEQLFGGGLMGSDVEDEQALTGSGQSLWGKSVSAQISQVPQAAFSGGNSFCTAMAPDGKNLLICGGEDPYLWNMQTRRKTELYPGDEITLFYLQEMALKIMTAQGVSSPDPAAMTGRELLAVYLRDMMPNAGGRCMRLVPYQTQNLSGRDLYLYDQYGCSWVLDCSSGALYARGKRIVCSTYENRMLSRSQPPEAIITETDLVTGKETGTDLSMLPGYSAGATVIAAVYLPDGSVCAVLRDRTLDMKNGEDCCLIVLTPAGYTEVYPLGRIRFGQEPDVIMSADGQRIIAFCRQTAAMRLPYRIDRTDGTVCLLASDGERVSALPLEDCLDPEGGAVTQPGGTPLFFLAPQTDGETLAVYDLDRCVLSLFQPASCEMEPMTDDPDSQEIPIPNYYTGNGYDRMLIQFLSDPGTVVVTLTVR